VSNIEGFKAPKFENTRVRVVGYLVRDEPSRNYERRFHLINPEIMPGGFCTFRLYPDTVDVNEQPASLTSANMHFVEIEGVLHHYPADTEAPIDMIPSFGWLSDLRIVSVGRFCPYRRRYMTR
jgi:hypothetical protein